MSSKSSKATGSDAKPKATLDVVDKPDAMTVRRLQAKANGSTGGGKRDQIVIPPSVPSIYEYNLSEKLIDRRRRKASPTTTIVNRRLPKVSKSIKAGMVKFEEEPRRPRLRFNVSDFRKKFNMKAVAIAELAFVKIAGRKMTVTSKAASRHF